MDEILLWSEKDCVCVYVLKGVGFACMYVYLGMLACVCVFMHVSLHSCGCSRASLWQWKTLISIVQLDYCTKATRFPLSQTFTASLWIWLPNANKLLLQVWTHYKQLLLSPLMKRTAKQEVLTTSRGGVITPGPNFRGYAEFFFWMKMSLCGFG